jgi:hypothetical protein
MDAVMRITRRALAIALPLLLAGCKGTEHLVGTPSAATEFRTIASMQPYITSSLTPGKALAQFGNPNSKSTAGVIMLVYDVENSQKVSLGFPSEDGLINFARVSDKSGASRDLPILP